MFDGVDQSTCERAQLGFRTNDPECVWVAGIELKIKSCLEGFHWTAYDHVFRNMPMWSEDPFPTKEEAQRDAEDAVERYLAGQLRDAMTPDEMDH